MKKTKINNSTINVVMYHYVREIKKSKYPNLKGLEFSKFKNQIEFFSKNLYMNTKQIKEMYSENMGFGSHGNYHYWFEFLKKNEQEKEITSSINFFKKLKFNTKSLSICFPYGSYNKETLSLLKKYKISYGLTTIPKQIDKKNISDHFIYPRFDTNDFPS